MSLHLTHAQTQLHTKSKTKNAKSYVYLLTHLRKSKIININPSVRESPTHSTSLFGLRITGHHVAKKGQTYPPWEMVKRHTLKPQWLHPGSFTTNWRVKKGRSTTQKHSPASPLFSSTWSKELQGLVLCKLGFGSRLENEKCATFERTRHHPKKYGCL